MTSAISEEDADMQTRAEMFRSRQENLRRFVIRTYENLKTSTENFLNLGFIVKLQPNIHFVVEPFPFEAGSFQYAFRAELLRISNTDKKFRRAGQNFVVKVPQMSPAFHSATENDLKQWLNACSQESLSRYNKAIEFAYLWKDLKVTKKIEISKCWVGQVVHVLHSTTENPANVTITDMRDKLHISKLIFEGSTVTIESYIEGKFIKYLNNDGQEIDSKTNLPAAFAHWTWQTSEGKFMVCDIQGVRKATKYTLTDPCIHSTANPSTRRYGVTDLGENGMIEFFRAHKCNDLCKDLRLESIRLQEKDADQYIDMDTRKATPSFILNMMHDIYQKKTIEEEKDSSADSSVPMIPPAYMSNGNDLSVFGPSPSPEDIDRHYSHHAIADNDNIQFNWTNSEITLAAALNLGFRAEEKKEIANLISEGKDYLTSKECKEENERAASEADASSSELQLSNNDNSLKQEASIAQPKENNSPIQETNRKHLSISEIDEVKYEEKQEKTRLADDFEEKETLGSERMKSSEDIISNNAESYKNGLEVENQIEPSSECNNTSNEENAEVIPSADTSAAEDLIRDSDAKNLHLPNLIDKERDYRRCDLEKEAQDKIVGKTNDINNEESSGRSTENNSEIEQQESIFSKKTVEQNNSKGTKENRAERGIGKESQDALSSETKTKNNSERKENISSIEITETKLIESEKVGTNESYLEKDSHNVFIVASKDSNNEGTKTVLSTVRISQEALNNEVDRNEVLNAASNNTKLHETNREACKVQDLSASETKKRKNVENDESDPTIVKTATVNDDNNVSITNSSGLVLENTSKYKTEHKNEKETQEYTRSTKKGLRNEENVGSSDMVKNCINEGIETFPVPKNYLEVQAKEAFKEMSMSDPEKHTTEVFEAESADRVEKNNDREVVSALANVEIKYASPESSDHAVLSKTDTKKDEKDEVDAVSSKLDAHIKKGALTLADVIEKENNERNALQDIRLNADESEANMDETENINDSDAYEIEEPDSHREKATKESDRIEVDHPEEIENECPRNYSEENSPSIFKERSNFYRHVDEKDSSEAGNESGDGMKPQIHNSGEKSSSIFIEKSSFSRRFDGQDSSEAEYVSGEDRKPQIVFSHSERRAVKFLNEDDQKSESLDSLEGRKSDSKMRSSNSSRFEIDHDTENDFSENESTKVYFIPDDQEGSAIIDALHKNELRKESSLPTTSSEVLKITNNNGMQPVPLKVVMKKVGALPFHVVSAENNTGLGALCISMRNLFPNTTYDEEDIKTNISATILKSRTFLVVDESGNEAAQKISNMILRGKDIGSFSVEHELKAFSEAYQQPVEFHKAKVLENELEINQEDTETILPSLSKLYNHPIHIARYMQGSSYIYVALLRSI